MANKSFEDKSKKVNEIIDSLFKNKKPIKEIFSKEEEIGMYEYEKMKKETPIFASGIQQGKKRGQKCNILGIYFDHNRCIYWRN